MKQLLLAVVLALGMGGFVQAASVEEIQIQSFATTPEVVSAMKELNSAFDKVLADNAITDVAALKTALKDGYYTKEFGEEYKKKNGGKAAPLDSSISALSDTGIALQSYYIQDNSNPLGSKHKLDKGADKSAYSAVHGKYHPGLRKYLEEQSLYDIFLYRLDGQNIYTCFKELDFARLVYDDNLKSTNLAEVVKAVADSKDKGFSILVDMKPYVYSYEVPARFVATGVYDGDTKIGVLVFQLPPGM